MPEQANPLLLNRQQATDLVAKNFSSQADLLTQMVNYASNLIPRAYSSSEQKLRDLVVCHALLKQFATMLDAVEILVRAGAVQAAFAPARVAFEASIYLEWILVSDGEKKATHYFVGNLREKRQWGKKVISGTPGADSFLADMGQVGADIAAQHSNIGAEGKNQVESVDAVLRRPDFAPVNSDFEAKKLAHPRKTEPKWYQVLGARNLRDLAKTVQRLPEYIVYYGRGSTVVHTAAYDDFFTFSKSGTYTHPIRHIADISTLLNFAMSNAITVFHRVLGFYRSHELQRFGQQYVTEWRAAFTNIPQVKIEIE